MKFVKNYESRKGVAVLDCQDGSRTKQSFKEECDINTIMKRYENTGVLPELIKTNPAYGDFSDVGTYLEAMSVVKLAEEQFSGLSAKVRDRFSNDPVKFLEFANNPGNGKEMIDLGLAQIVNGVVEEKSDPEVTLKKSSSSKKSADE